MINQTKHVFRASPNLWAHELWKKHEELHWLPEETPMLDDIRDWKEKATKAQRDFIKNISLFFTQADIEVENTYIDEYLKYYRDDLYIRQMLVGFANRETIHVTGYAYLVDSLALGDETFSAFMSDPVLMRLHEAMNRWKGTDVKDRFRRMVATSLLGEGTMLFGLFAMLLNFQRFNLFNGMCTIVAWSIRDEDLHVQGIARLIKHDSEFNTLSAAQKRKLFHEVEALMMPLVVQFTQNCFNGEAIEGIELEDVVEFLMFQAQRRARQANIIEDDITAKNPFPWFDQIVGGIEDGNFFERRRTEYAKNNLIGEWTY